MIDVTFGHCFRSIAPILKINSAYSKMAAGGVKSLPRIWGKTPPLGVLVLLHQYISYLLSKKSILTAPKIIAITVRNLKFDAKVHFISNRGQNIRGASTVGAKIPKF